VLDSELRAAGSNLAQYFIPKASSRCRRYSSQRPQRCPAFNVNNGCSRTSRSVHLWNCEIKLRKFNISERKERKCASERKRDIRKVSEESVREAFFWEKKEIWLLSHNYGVTIGTNPSRESRLHLRYGSWFIPRFIILIYIYLGFINLTIYQCTGKYA
jgi:hypothetical protein